MFQKLIESLKTLWNRLFEKKRPSLEESPPEEEGRLRLRENPLDLPREDPPKKKFEIQQEQSNPNPIIIPSLERTGRKFEIQEERERVDSTIINTTNSEGGFNIHAATRPKMCPVCRTEGRITRLESGEWQCKECEHIWGRRENVPPISPDAELFLTPEDDLFDFIEEVEDIEDIQPENEALNGQTSPRGRFEIQGEREIVEPIIVSTTNSESGFNIHAATRPKVCPVCRTEGRITRLESGEWQCKECEHTWR